MYLQNTGKYRPDKNNSNKKDTESSSSSGSRFVYFFLGLKYLIFIVIKN